MANHTRPMPYTDNIKSFLASCHALTMNSPHVSIDRKRLSELTQSFNKAAGTAPAWDNYISEAAKTGKVNPTRIFFEMAVVCAQQGGFIYPDDQGQPQKWHLNGSGAAAMVAKMDEIRTAKALPYVDVRNPEKLQGKLQPLMDGVPFADDRLTMFSEFSSRKAYKKLDKLMRTQKGNLHFDFDFINAVADIFPQSFKSDPFRKKVILAALMTAGHLESRGVSVTVDLPVASDYVLPQVLEGLGVIKLSKEFEEALVARKPYAEKDDVMRDLRAATISACAIMAHEGQLRAQDIDAALWLAGRDPAVKPKLKPPINVYTMWF